MNPRPLTEDEGGWAGLAGIADRKVVFRQRLPLGWTYHAAPTERATPEEAFKAVVDWPQEGGSPAQTEAATPP